MKESDKEAVIGTIDRKGFDYAFVNYSAFERVKDKRFHELRLAFLTARNELADYIGLPGGQEASEVLPRGNLKAKLLR